MVETPPSALLRSLEEATAAYPLDRKLLVCPSVGVGREILRALVTSGCSWLGWEVTTPGRLAMDLAGPALADRDVSPADRFETQAIMDEALDRQLAREPFRELRELGEAVGFRDAVANAVTALRLAGVSPARLRATPGSNTRVRDLLADTLSDYQDALTGAGLVDTAETLSLAAALARESEPHGDTGPLDDASVYLLPGLPLRGMAGALVRALLDRGARVLESDPVAGVDVPPVTWSPAAARAPLSTVLGTPTIPNGTPGADAGGTPGIRLDMFAATGPAQELREVLRRVVEAGLRWDEVEIVATDPVVYGSALHALAGELGIRVSYGVGLPVERTRTGRATAAYLRWISTGFPADVLRHLLESGDVAAPGSDAAESPRLARRLRRLRVGWGRDRYLPAIRRRLDALDAPVRPRRYESEEDAARRVTEERAELESLRAILAPILDATPQQGAAADAGNGVEVSRDGGRVSPGALAEGLRRFLELVPEADGPSATARRRLLAAADRMSATLRRESTPAAALAVLRQHLEIRVPAPDHQGSAPWVSSGGHLHITDVDHGGFTGRRATFVVGLDADRFPGRGLQDPLLLDAQRRALDPDALPTSGDRLAGARFRMAALLARLRGTVTLSYSAWDPAEARNVAPAAVLLQAFRLREGEPGATFADLHEALGDAASAIPRSGSPLDGTDAWLQALDRRGIFLSGRDVVRAAFPRLDAGLRARAALDYERPTEYHGLIRPRPELDPRSSGAILSATRVQDLGTCGLRYLYRSVLNIRPPDDPEADPDRWLDPMDRGRLLHTVYEGTLRTARAEGLEPGDDSFTELADRVLERELESMRLQVPPPGEAVAERERAELLEDVRSFAHMVAGNGADWVDLELKFGLEGRPPATIRTPGGTLRLRGAIDRVDRTGTSLRVIDYKTGRPTRFSRSSGVFDGGRRLQNVIYAAVAESLLEGRVERMEYHFPTRRGENTVRGYGREDLRRGLALLDRLFDLVASGRFLPTEDPDDCRFCDYGPICRVRSQGYGHVAPMAEWAAERAPTAEAYQGLMAVRRFEEWVQSELGADAEA